MKEEINLELDKKDIKLFFSSKSETEKVICDDYYIKINIPDIQNLKLQKSEVASVHWFSENEIKYLMKQGNFFSSHYDDFEILLNWLKNNKP